MHYYEKYSKKDTFISWVVESYNDFEDQIMPHKFNWNQEKQGHLSVLYPQVEINANPP
jgi:hypothetical protein